MNFDLLLFDADDTLFDFRRSERISFEKTLADQDHEGDVEGLYTSYKEFSLALWKKFEKGQIKKDQIKTKRFAQTFEAHKLEMNVDRAAEAYLNFLPENVFLVEGTLALLEKLHQKIPMGIITNGIAEVQKRRFAKSGIEEFFDFMVVSEECGHPKPHPRMFEISLDKAGAPPKERVLVIGDRLETDIKGALNFGMKSCWFNPQGNANATRFSPHFEIKSLDQIQSLLS